MQKPTTKRDLLGNFEINPKIILKKKLNKKRKMD